MLIPGVTALRTPLPANNFTIEGTIQHTVEQSSGENNLALPTVPGGILQNDIILVAAGMRNGTLPTPAGYASIGGAGTLPAIRSSYKRMGITPDTQLTVNSSSSTWDASYQIAVIRGCNTTTLVDNTPTANDGLGSTASISSLATVTAPCLRFVHHGWYDGDFVGGSTIPFGWTLLFDFATPDAEHTSLLLYKWDWQIRDLSPGNISKAVSTFWENIHYALREEPVP